MAKLRVLWRKLLRRVLARVIRWEIVWNRPIPQGDPPVVKDIEYWKMVSAVLENRPFINELAELQGELEAQIRAALLDDSDTRKIARMQVALYGMRRINDLLVSANNRYLALKDELLYR